MDGFAIVNIVVLATVNESNWNEYCANIWLANLFSKAGQNCTHCASL